MKHTKIIFSIIISVIVLAAISCSDNNSNPTLPIKTNSSSSGGDGSSGGGDDPGGTTNPYAINAEDFKGVLDTARLSISQNSYDAVKSISAALLMPDGSIVSAVSNAEADPYPVTSDMKFSIGSATKMFVAATIYQLIDENKLNVTDTLQALLYDEGVLDFEVFGEKINPNIRVLDLLSHTTGIDDFLGDLYYMQLGLNLYYTELGEDLTKIWDPVADTLSCLTDPYYDYEDSKFKYSNTNYIILGLIIEHITGKKIYPLMQEMLLDPLNMKNTYMVGVNPYWGLLSLPEPNAIGFGKSYDYEVDPYNLIWIKASTIVDVDAVGLYTSTWVSGNMVSTSAEMARWSKFYYDFQLSRGNIDKNTLNAMSIVSDYFQARKYGRGIEYLKHNNTRELWGHTGTIIGFNSLVLYMPSKKVGIAILLNSHRAARWDVLNEVVKYINEKM